MSGFKVSSHNIRFEHRGVFQRPITWFRDHFEFVQEATNLTDFASNRLLLLSSGSEVLVYEFFCLQVWFFIQMPVYYPVDKHSLENSSIVKNFSRFLKHPDCEFWQFKLTWDFLVTWLASNIEILLSLRFLKPKLHFDIFWIYKKFCSSRRLHFSLSAVV